MSTDGPIVVFDGVCVLCNGWLRFLLRHDRHARLRFAAMQAPAGRALLAAHGLDPDDPASFLLVDAGRAWTDTDAIVRVLDLLAPPWPALGAMLGWLPRRVRDTGYRFVARHRYRLFGRYDRCALPPPDAAIPFLE